MIVRLISLNISLAIEIYPRSSGTLLSKYVYVRARGNSNMCLDPINHCFVFKSVKPYFQIC